MGALQALLTAFSVGTVTTVCIRLLLPDVKGAIFAAVAAIVVIFWLGWYSYRHRDTRDLNRVGDDLYYLGLLFTLVSLIYVLVWLFIFNPDEDLERRTYTLIGNFGIGLLSTVAGIFGRILAQSLADGAPRPPDEPAAPAGDNTTGDGTEEVGFDLIALRRELRDATNAFGHFTRITLNQAEQTKVHTERLIQDFNENMAASAKQEFEHTVAAWRQISDVMTPLRRELQETADAFGRHARTTQQQAEQTKTNMEHLFQALEKQIAELLKHMASADHSLVTFATSVEAVDLKVQTLGETATSAATGLDERAVEIVNAHNALAQGAKQYQEIGLQTYQDAVSKFMNTAHEQLSSELGVWLAAIEALTAAGQAQQKMSERSVEEGRRLIEKMSAEASQWTTASEHMRNSLGAVMEDLTDIEHKR